MEHSPNPENGPRWVTIYRDGEVVGKRAYCFHVYCWQSLQGNLGSEKNVDSRTIFKIARSTIFTHTAEISFRGKMLWNGLEILISRDTSGSFQTGDPCGSLTELLQRAWEKLPAEIVVQVLTHLGPCIVRSLLSLQVGHIDHLVHRINRHPRLEPSCVVPITSSMVAHMTYIKGTKYLCGLQSGTRIFGYTGDATELSTFVPEEVTGLKFTLGQHGIMALHYMKLNPCSDSVGRAKPEAGTWIGILKLPTRSREIRLSWDGSISRPNVERNL